MSIFRGFFDGSKGIPMSECPHTSYYKNLLSTISTINRCMLELRELDGYAQDNDLRLFTSEKT
jgi:hypothetical protein